MRLIIALCLVSAETFAQWAPSTRPGLSSGGNLPTPALPASVAWYGDSITQGACNGTAPPNKLAALLVGHSVVNKGVSAEEVAQIVGRYFTSAGTECGGELCGTYIFAGVTNDCGLGVCDVDEVVATMLTAVDHALGLGRRVAVINGPPNRTCPEQECIGGNAAGVLKMLEYRSKLAIACSARPSVTCLDAWAGMEAEYVGEENRGWLKTEYRCSDLDRVHTSQAGADYLAELAKTAFPPSVWASP